MSAVAAIILALVVKYVLTAPYVAITGYVPFDAQPRLSQFMVGVELGGFDEGAAAGVYMLFAIGDALSAAATACFFVLLWTWLFATAPNRLFGFLTRGGIVMVPVYVLALDLAAKAGFLRLTSGLEEPAYAATVDFSVVVHRMAVGLADLRNYLTAAFVMIAIVSLSLNHRAARKDRAPL